VKETQAHIYHDGIKIAVIKVDYVTAEFGGQDPIWAYGASSHHDQIAYATQEMNDGYFGSAILRLSDDFEIRVLSVEVN
jgi:hypothetical protein